MIARRILTVICLVFVLVEARHKKRSIPSLCDPKNFLGKVLCYCTHDRKDPQLINWAECFITTERIEINGHEWDNFEQLKMTPNITLKNNKGIPLPYIPTHGLKHLENVIVLNIKSGSMENIPPYAFANLSSVEEINVYDTQVKTLSHHAFAHHKDLVEIKLDKNYLIEINRDVFVDLPSLERLYITNNYITTLHDRAFIHLNNLKELELNVNKIFSLNTETFAGLWKLQKLDLSTNKIQVIGDNTFLPLKNLEYLNLEWNKIEVLDDKAFHGLAKLQALSLAYNKLTVLDNVKAFVGLKSLTGLNLRANNMKRFKEGVLAPIIEHFYDADSHVDIAVNNFNCDCELDWFMPLMNKTKNKYLKIDLENLQCVPDDKLKEAYLRIKEKEEEDGVTYEEKSGSEYEYYDVVSNEGNLFYTDVRELLYCDQQPRPVTPAVVYANTPKWGTRKNTQAPRPTNSTTEATQSPATTKSIAATHTSIHTVEDKVPVTKKISTETLNSGLLDLSIDESNQVDIDETTEQKKVDSTLDETTSNNADKTSQRKEEDLSLDESFPVNVDETTEKKKVQLSLEESRINVDKSMEQKKVDSYTTTRLATVSANPIEKTNMYDKMASDEALPEKLKAQRRHQPQLDDRYMPSNGNKTILSGPLMALICFWLFKLY